MPRSLSILLAAAGVALLADFAVRAQDAPLGDASRGEIIFRDTGRDLAYPSCAQCHATVPAAQELKKTGHILPGHPVYDTAHRGAWKNHKPGTGPRTAADAGNICVVAFQKRAKLDAAQLRDLNAYLLSISPDRKVKPLVIGYKPTLPSSLEGGDAKAGKKEVAIHCSGCHGKGDDKIGIAFRPNKIKRLKVAMKVRGYIRDSKAPQGRRFKPESGQMSFWAKDRLPDKDLLDIIAYLGK